ncbi:MAG: hypothetical protein J6330_06860, partial [Clostridia bacterium]|nr:hypothetical protein [Clostridia bacterium]
MKKTLSIVLSIVMILSVFCFTASAEGEAKVVTVVMADQDFSESMDIDAGNGVTLSFAKGSGSSKPAYIEPEVRMYLNNTLTVSVSSDAGSITGIVFTLNSGKSNVLNANAGEYDSGVWSGDSASVTFTNPTSGKTGQVWISKIVVLLNGASEEPPVTYDTPEEILAAAYGLATGATLEGGPYTLSGVVTEIVTAYSSDYGNITVNMVVDDVTAENNTIQCYHLKDGEGIEAAAILAVNDHITVTGNIKNYKGTVEFDANCTIDAYEEGEHQDVPIYTTPEEILAAAYELEVGSMLSEGYKYTLEGVITTVDTAYNATYGNITVTIKVDDVTAADNTIKCFRMVNGSGVDGVDKIAAGDHIKVTGVIKNYQGTVEFDANCTLDEYTKAATPTYDTEEDIVNALYELDPNTSLAGGPFSLTGVITAVNTEYSEKYGNVTVTIVVGELTDKPVQCYRLKDGEDINGVRYIGVGDEITVVGELKHYQSNAGVSTYEFDANCELTAFTFNSPKFMLKQISLAGDIGMHFYMDLSMLTEQEREASYVEFTIGKKTATAEFDPGKLNSTEEYYGFTCRLNALQIGETVVATYHYG